MSASAICFCSVVVFLIAFGAITYYDWTINLEFEREIEVHFEYADRASDAGVKAAEFNKFIAALEEHELTKGPTSKLFQEQPNSQLDLNYQAAKSLQKRLNELASLDPLSDAYQYGMRQVTTQEFCWFPIQAFKDAYSLRHGGILYPLTPGGARDLCHTSD